MLCGNSHLSMGRASMSRLNLLSLIGCLVFYHFSCPLSAAEPFQFRHEHVLGTSCEINVWARSREQAQPVEATLLTEIDRLQKIFSAHDRHSELMRWQRGELKGDQLSTELVKVLSRAEFWRAASGGAFDVRAGELAKVWQTAVQQQRVPSDAALEQLSRALRNPPYTIDASSTLQRNDTLAISLDAIAKGFILDAACEKVSREHAALLADSSDQRGVSVMIGGDMRRLGSAAQTVAIANPFDAGENSPAIGSVVLHGSVGLATSGGYRRYFEIDGVKHSHILDPRTGQSAVSVAGVTVIAPCGMDADAAATTVSVLGAAQGLKLIEALDGYAAMCVLNSGEVITSSRWNDFQTKPATERPIYVNVTVSADDKDKSGLFVKFTLGAAGGGRYHRPYVAVWLEDKDGFPVKTAVLWLQTTGPGPRWHRDLTKWYGNDQMRKLVDQTELIGNISGATRGAGEYETRFDGNDNDGKPLKPGKYALCLEAAREHGTHQFVREPIEWSDKPIAKKELKGGTEFSAVSYRFVPGAAAPSKAR